MSIVCTMCTTHNVVLNRESGVGIMGFNYIVGLESCVRRCSIVLNRDSRVGIVGFNYIVV